MNKLIIIAFITTCALSAACPADPYCTSCDGAKCLICVNSFLGANDICQAATAEIDNCYTYATATTCSECDWDYYVSSNTCKKITLDGCAMLNENGTTCFICADSKLPVNGLCADGTECTLENCEFCLSATVCYECDAGYSVGTDGKCVKNTVTGCTNIASATCAVCDWGYYHTGTSCVETDVQGNYAGILSAIIALVAFVKVAAL